MGELMLTDFITTWIIECGIGPRRDEIYTNAPGWCCKSLEQIKDEYADLLIARTLWRWKYRYEGKERNHYHVTE